MSIEQNIENLEIRNANVVTFVGTSSTMVDTISGRIQCKGFQHNSNVITDISGPHGRVAPTLKKYPEIIFEEGKFDKDEGDTSSNTYIQAGYVVRASSQVPTSDGEFDERQVWRLFDGLRANGTDHEGWMSRASSYETTGLPAAASPTRFTGDQGQWVEISLPHKIKLQRFSIAPGNNNNSLGNAQARFPKVIAIHGYDGLSWTRLQEFTTTQVQSLNETQTFEITTPTGYHEKFVLVVKQTWTADVSTNSSLTHFDEWKLYGYEEDPPAGDHSVDTTFKSRFNNPQLAGVQVFVDGKGSGSNQIAGGPVVTDTVESYDETGKYWNLTGELTSNISVEANTFLEGDQPHAVSVWFNSSNLEANVSNTCVFSIASEEKLDSVNLDLQSNTWHNLTYAYQGESGSRVTYLDGRKVAEDQAEDTFGDYPPFAMTGYSQGGYVVSSSGRYDGNTNWYEYEAFNKTTTGTNAHLSQGGSGRGLDYYNDGSGGYTRSPPATIGVLASTGATINQGEFLKIEMPNKIIVNYISQIAMGDRARDFKWYGSNDDYNWTQLLSVVDAPNDTNKHTFTTTTKDAFRYFAIVVSKLYTTSHQYFRLDDIRLYGHRENDLVRLPDPTNVLKYPHIIINEQAKRGYVVSQSSQQVPPSTTGSYQAFNIFDGNLVFDGGSGAAHSRGGAWITGGVYNSSGNPTGAGVASTNVTGQSPVATPGEWFQLELPHKVKLSSIRVMGNTENVTRLTERSPVNAVLAGSNDGTTWTTVLTYTGASWTTLNEFKSFPANVDSTNAYKYFRFIITKNGGESSAALQEFEFYGTGVDSVPIQIGGGNIDKVANFRVYDKFIEEDQALEIWDAQKDEFGRAKPQMVLQQGKFGIGTNAPQGSLSVADEPHNLEEFPPRAMTAEETYMEGHGVFRVALSSADNGNNKWTAFNKRGFTGTDDNDYLEWGTQYTAATGVYTGSVSTQGVSGEWLEIEMPYKIKLEYNLLYHRTRDGTITNDYWVLERMPRDGAILGSNDGEMWTTLQSWTDFDWVTGTSATGQRQSEYWRTPGKFVTNSTAYYKTFRLVFSKLFGANGDRPNIGEWRLFGTREQGQSVLHDGQLTLTKSLTVPRIGPALDADDTPRRDRLVVEYNTSTNPTFEGAVRDTSGRGLDGTLVGSSYNATKKALVFDGSNDIIEADLGSQIFKNSSLHTTSLWVKLHEHSSDFKQFFSLGNGLGNPDGNLKHIQLFHSDNYGLRLSFTQHDYRVGEVVPIGQWVHVAYTFDGTAWQNTTTPTNVNIYINGTKVGITSVYEIPGGGGTLDLSTAKLGLGASTDFAATNDRQFAHCDLSNFKLYDTMLTAEEVKTLYDMGRCDEGHHVVNFSKTRVGIGLGDGEAPRAALDVRDKLIVGSQLRSGNTVGVGELEVIGSVSIGALGAGVHEPGVKFYDTSGGNARIFLVSNDVLSFEVAGFTKGYLRPDSGAVFDNFTGQHRTFIKDVPFSQAGDLEGLIVSSDQNKYIKMSGGIEAGSNAITTNESLPVVSLSTTTNDKKCFGVISASEDPETREDEYGNFVSVSEKEKGDTRVYINSVGEGAIWVVNTNGSLESGDYITTSNVVGYGQKQDSEFLANYTVAKITMDCDFEPATRPVQQILRSNVVQTYYLGDVHHVKSVPYEIITTEEGESNVIYDTKYTLTTTANVTESDPWDNVFIDPPEVTYATYSNLEANVQSTYTLTFTQTTTDEKTPTEWSALESNVQSLYNKVYYQSVEQEVAADYPGAVAHTRVTDQIENTLDEYGQIQWEDHPTETEKAYKVRYLTVDGTQTDEANAVHIAAFVGCTYHCG